MESMSIKELSNRVKMIHCTSDSIRRGRGMRQNNIEIQKSRPDPQFIFASRGVFPLACPPSFWRDLPFNDPFPGCRNVAISIPDPDLRLG